MAVTAALREVGKRHVLGVTWAITAVATAASVYALDAVATVCGFGLVAWGVLSGLDVWAAMAFLAISYVVWGFGLRAAVAANWVLLTETATSTNLLSKLAHDLVATRSMSVRARRIAAAGGYVGTELVKELPYYAGAVGTSLLSEAVSANEAIVFLGGANLGAAAYEYALALATRALLRRRYASFETDWVPQEYLSDYYATVQPDEVETMAFMVDAMQQVQTGDRVLYFGVGPTLHHVFLAAPKASEIHLGDYLESNLDEIRRWIDRDPAAHDWRPFVRFTLQCEGLTSPTDAEIASREELTRSKITRLLRVDAHDNRPLAQHYPVVVSAYCADSATDDRETWRSFMHHIAGLVRPGGIFVTAALRHSRSYQVGGKAFPSADVDEEDVRAVLTPECGFDLGVLEARHLGDSESHGYEGIVLGWARRRTNDNRLPSDDEGSMSPGPDDERTLSPRPRPALSLASDGATPLR